MEKYYHMFANGDDAKDFITSEKELKAAFNRFAICSFISKATVMSASVEETHPHALLRGTDEQCCAYKNLYRNMSLHYISRNRGSAYGINLNCELYEITDEQYLRNVAAYTIVQATKDGKPVMPYDYKYGTGALYFRKPWSVMPWLVSDDGFICSPQKISELTYRERRAYFPHTVSLPDNWLVCNGFILPSNYVDISGYERLFVTHNCFRAYQSSGKSKDDPIINKMSSLRGVVIEDLEARRLYNELCLELFGNKSSRNLSPEERLLLARTMRQRHHLSYRQLSTLSKIPESELRKYI